MRSVDSKLYVKTCLFLINLTSMSLCKKRVLIFDTK